MEAGVHLPQIDLMGEGLSSVRTFGVVDAARDGGFVAVSANDHFVFPVPWLDGLTSLSAVVDRSGDMDLTTTLSLPSLRGPVPVAKTLAALDVLSGGRVIAGLGPGSSPGDYRALGIGFDERWARFEESVAMVRALLAGDPPPDSRYYSAPEQALRPLPVQRPVPIWLGSWGSPTGLRRVARLGDGWLASAYNTTPEAFADSVAALEGELDRVRRSGDVFPHALVTMWTWITESRGGRPGRQRAASAVAAPRLRRPARTSLCRPRADVRGAPVRLRSGRVSSRALLAPWRRSSTDRADRNPGDAARARMKSPDLQAVAVAMRRCADPRR